VNVSPQFIFAGIVLLAGVSDVAATQYMVANGQAARYLFWRADTMSQKTFGVWWIWRIMLWLILVVGMAFFHTRTAGAVPLIAVVPVAATDVFRAVKLWRNRRQV
jgi:hypothetical protein